MRLSFSIILILGLCFTAASATEAPAQIYRDAVKHQQRPESDLDRDASRHPEAILEFIRLEPGMTVIELGAGGGYTTELVARTVGQAGKVYAQALQPSRVSGNRLPNVVALDSHPLYQLSDKLAAAGFETGDADAVLIFFALHDMYLNPRIDKQRLYREIHQFLKPGGVLVVLDNAAEPDSGTRDTRTLHRIGEQFVIEEIQRAGLMLEQTSDSLRNTNDDLRKSWSSSGSAVPRGFQDRFALRFHKPGSS
jgi:predicted methyltransferase